MAARSPVPSPGPRKGRTIKAEDDKKKIRPQAAGEVAAKFNVKDALALYNHWRPARKIGLKEFLDDAGPALLEQAITRYVDQAGQPLVITGCLDYFKNRWLYTPDWLLNNSSHVG